MLETLVRELLGSQERFKVETLAKLSALEQEVLDLSKDLKGNGQPGRISKLESKVDKLSERLSSLRGNTMVIAGAISVIAFALFKIFG